MGGQRLQAGFYDGTIHGVVMSVSQSSGAINPWYVGEQLTGSYFYESPTIDGTFSGLQFGPVRNLYGGISTGNGGSLLDSWSFGDSDNWNSTLTVQGGVVTYMDVDGEAGPNNWWFYANHFLLYYNDLTKVYQCSGTLTVTEVPEPQPSTLIAAALLAVTFGSRGIRILRSRKPVA
jgi:hypothetical protein